MHLKNLNSVRVIAAFMVVIHHIEQSKSLRGFPNHFNNNAFLLAGKLGVIIFFALSGFLITILLLIEQSDTGHIHLKEFYIRRILRIWPLYFLVIGLSIFVWPHIPGMQIPGWVDPYKHLFLNLLLFICLLPNLQQMGIGPIPFAAQSWSIGTEEQFYIFWLLIIGLGAKFKINRLIIVLLSSQAKVIQ